MSAGVAPVPDGAAATPSAGATPPSPPPSTPPNIGPGSAWLGDWLRTAQQLQASGPEHAQIAHLLGLSPWQPATPPDDAAAADVPTPDGAPAALAAGRATAAGENPDPSALAPDDAAARLDGVADGAAREDFRLPSRLAALAPQTHGPGQGGEYADPRANPPAGWDRLAPLQVQAMGQRPPPPLLPPGRRRALLTALLSGQVADGEPDVDRIVAQAAAGLPITRLPRRTRRTLRDGVDLRIDRAAWLAPFAADQDALAAYLRRLLPPARLRVAQIEATPTELPPPRRRRKPLPPQPVLPRAPVLLLSDLGQGTNLFGPQPASPADPAQWRRWAQGQRSQGRRVLALSPRPGVAARASGIPVWHWHEGLCLTQVIAGQPGGAAGAARGVAPGSGMRDLGPDSELVDLAPDSGVRDLAPDSARAAGLAGIRALAQLVSPAQRITPGLLREARRAVRPALPPAAEADLWFSPLVDLRGHDALVLAPELRAALLASLHGDLRAKALALLRRSWQGRADVAVVEEALVAAELDSTLDETTAQHLLAPALKALAAAPGASAGPTPRTRDAVAAAEVAGWAVHAWQRFSPAVRATDAARLLAYSAARHLRGGAASLADAQGRLPTLPADSAWSSALLQADAAPQVHLSLELRRYADGSTNLVIGPARPPTTALHRITLPLLGPLWLEVAGGLVGEGSEAPPQVVAIDPTQHTQVEVRDSFGIAPLTLRALGGAGWQLWEALSLEEGTQPAWLYNDAGLALLMLDATRALLWPGEVVRRDPGRVLMGLADLPFSRDPTQRPGVTASMNDPVNAPVHSTRVRVLGPLPMHRGLVAVQVLDPPPDCAPLDPEARPAGSMAGATAAGRDHPYLGLPQPGQRPVEATLTYHGEGSYTWQPELPAPGLLLPGYGHYGPMLVTGPKEGEGVVHGDIVVPMPLDKLRRAARDLAPPLWKALIVALPGAEKEAFSLWDHLINSIGMERVAHDHDGRFLPRPAERAQVLRGCDLVLLVGTAKPQADARAALEEALSRGMALAWLPLLELAPSHTALMLQDWPPALRHALQSAPPLDTTDHMAQAARAVVMLMDAPQPRGGGDAPALATSAPPVPALGLASSLRSTLLRKLDSRTDTEIGLFRLRLPQRGGTLRFEPATWPSDGPPGLLLIHGELSDTEPSFGALWQGDNADVQRLRAHYGERIYAWRWRTVSPGIARNALDLPIYNGAPMHLLTLGAGGLLIELVLALFELNAASIDDWQRRIWQDLADVPAVQDERQALLDWVARRARGSSGNLRRNKAPDRAQPDSTARRIPIERFVRVACPAAGTPVFGPGFDRWLNLLRRVPGLGLLGSALPDTVLDDPAAAPGLAGLVPGAGVLPLLTTQTMTDTPLAIVAGVVRGDSLGSWVKSVASRAVGLGGADSDGVVPLASALGGIERRGGVDHLVVQGPDASHFRYFEDPATRRAIVDALLSPPGQVPGFGHADSLAELQRRHAPAATRPRRKT